MRSRPGKHLTREGVRLAREVGHNLGSFDVVVTSDAPRAIETAIAMGYASDQQIDDLFGADLTVEGPAGFAAIAAAALENEHVARAADKHAQLIRRLSESLPDEGRALVISHGGVVELSVVGLLPNHDFRSWGPPCGYCEGVRLTFQGDACTADLLRLADLLPPS